MQNVYEWLRVVEIFLGGCFKLGYINGKIEDPSEDDHKNEEWISNNMLVMSWMLNSMKADVR